MRTVILAAKALRDLEQIWVYIASDNFDAADRVRLEIDTEIRKLAENPGMGHTRQELKDTQLRVWSLYQYLIMYRFDDTELIVIRVVHGARDIGNIVR